MGSEIGYVFRRLGIEDEERNIDPQDVEWEKYFETAENEAEAVAVLITLVDPTAGEQFESLGVIDENGRGLVWCRQKTNNGGENGYPISELKKLFPKPTHNIKFVKLKTPTESTSQS
jgi:hypothetical protein